jgi:Raf kinase inhibitor-like YbhB/YbcL family protein
MRRLTLALASLALLGAAGPKTQSFTLSSPAFRNGGMIPIEFSCEGMDTSPELKISGVPKKAKSLALIMDDPDAVPVIGRVADHWVVWNIPANTKAIAAGSVPKGAVQGKALDARKYQGPCPPPGSAHRYFFRLYALNVPKLKLPAGSTSAKLRAAMRGRILKETKLMGTYTAQSPMM